MSKCYAVCINASDWECQCHSNLAIFKEKEDAEKFVNLVANLGMIDFLEYCGLCEDCVRSSQIATFKLRKEMLSIEKNTLFEKGVKENELYSFIKEN